MASSKKDSTPKRSSWGKLIDPNDSIVDVGARSQARLSAALALGVGLFYFLGAFGSYMGSGNRSNVIGLIIVGVACIIAYLISRGKHYQIGSGLLVGTITLSTYFFILTSDNNPIISLYASLPIAFILGNFLLPTWGMVLLIVLNVIAILFLPKYFPNLTAINVIVIASTLGISGALLIITSIIRSSIERQRLKETKDINISLQTLQQSLEKQVEERTRQVKVALEISQGLAGAFHVEDLLSRTVDLIVERFGYYNASIFLLDDTHQMAILQAAGGNNAGGLISKKLILPLNSPSVVSWVIGNRTPRLVTDTTSDPIHLKEELLPNTRSEVCVPIMFGTQVLGALDLQSQVVDGFDSETVSLLQTLAGQIASAIRNVRLLETTELSLLDASDVFRASAQIARAQSEDDTYDALQKVFANTPFTVVFLIVENHRMRMVTSPTGSLLTDRISSSEFQEISPVELGNYFNNEILADRIVDIPALNNKLKKLFTQMGFISVGMIPVMRDTHMVALMVLGKPDDRPLTISMVQPYTGIAELVVSTVERLRAEKMIEGRLREIEAISATSQAISTSTDLGALFRTLHDNIRIKMGDVNFLIALYNADTAAISIPYMYEKGQEISSLESFPLGEGLTSILIRTKQPLMIIDDTERRTLELGAKIVGQPAKSWMGTPLIVSGNVMGALIVQDTEKDHAFTESDLGYVTTLSAQVAGAIYNARLLIDTRKRTLELQTASEIARDISGSLDLNELLAEAVTMIRERFSFYHASVFLVDASGDFAVVREATGEAGIQMKRAFHKLKVGSKSIVGYATGSGEPLVVNDTTRDATYYANPLLPETRSEVAIPLKVGTRILGALDVQSTESFSFTKEDVDVLRILADQLAIAVLNSELFAETQEHLSQHRLLHHVTTAAASGTTLEEALASAAQGLQVTLGGDRVAIMLVNKDKHILQVRAIAGYSEEVKQIEIPIGDGITGWVAAHQQAQRVGDVTKDDRYIQAGANIRSELAIPMIYRGEVLGILDVESDQPSAYSENDEELLGTLGGSLAAIIANARLLEQIRHQADRERLLYEVTSKIRRSTDIQTILKTTTSELSKALGARRAEIEIDVGANQGGKVVVPGSKKDE